MSFPERIAVYSKDTRQQEKLLPVCPMSQILARTLHILKCSTEATHTQEALVQARNELNL